MHEQKEDLPENDGERAGFSDVPGPVTTPFGLGPNHAEDHSHRGQAGRNAAEGKAREVISKASKSTLLA